MDRKQSIELTNMCMVYKNGRVLVEEKIIGENQKGIIFPGGHVEQGESLKDSREFDTLKFKKVLQSLETGLFLCQIFIFII